MESLRNYNELKTLLETKKDLYLLLYKEGTTQSECAVQTLERVKNELKVNDLYGSNVVEVRDIHSQFDIKSAPSFLEFKEGRLVNVIKGCQSEIFYANYLKSNFSNRKTGNGTKQHHVLVYTTPTCTWCNTIKNYFKANNVRFREIDVTKDDKAGKEMVRRSGQQGVPQSVIDGQVIIGFDKLKIDNLLELNSNNA